MALKRSFLKSHCLFALVMLISHNFIGIYRISVKRHVIVERHRKVHFEHIYILCKFQVTVAKAHNCIFGCVTHWSLISDEVDKTLLDFLFNNGYASFLHICFKPILTLVCSSVQDQYHGSPVAMLEWAAAAEWWPVVLSPSSPMSTWCSSLRCLTPSTAAACHLAKPLCLRIALHHNIRLVSVIIYYFILACIMTKTLGLLS